MNRCVSLLRSALAQDSIRYFSSKIVPGFMGVVSIPVFIQLIGLDQYGRFAVMIPFLMAVAGASTGWLAQGVLRFHPASADPKQYEIQFARAVTRAMMASALITSVLLAAVLAGLRYPFLAALVSLAFCLSLAVYTVTLARLQAQLRPAMVLRREIIRSVGGFVIPVILIAAMGRRQFEFLLLGQAIAYSLASIRGVWVGGPNEIGAQGKFQSGAPPNGQIIRQLWGFGWAVGLWLLLSQGLPVIDRWTIQRFAGYTNAGVYSSLYDIAIRSFSFLVFPVTQAAHPRIMRAWNQGEFAVSHRLIRHSILSQVVIFMAVLGAVVLAAHRITRLILGFDDPTAAQMLPILFVGGFLWQLALLLHKPLEIAQRTTAMLAGMTVVVVLNVIACLAFIPRFGYPAAAYILVLSASSYIAFTMCMTRFRAVRRFPEATEACGEFSD